MINKIKASLELVFLVFTLFLFIIGISIYGFFKIKKIDSNSHELYKDRLLPIDQLANVRYASWQNISLTQQANSKLISYAEAKTKISEAQNKIKVNWRAYSLTYITPIEKQIARKTLALLNKSSVIVDSLVMILEKEDKVALNNFVEKDLFANLEPVLNQLNKLIKLQVQIAKNIDEDNLSDFSTFIERILLTLIGVFLFAIPFAYYLIRKNRSIISDFNQNTDKLIASEENYRNIIEYACEAIIILNQDTHIIDLNDYACKLLGYSHEELLQMDISQIIPKSELYSQKQDVEKIKREGVAILNRKIKGKDNSEIDVEISIRLIEGKGFFAIIHDITERKKTELLIKESEEKYRYLFNNNPGHIIVWDLESLQILEVNDAVVEKYGYSREEWISMTVLDYRPIEDREGIINFAKDFLDQDKDLNIQKRNWRHLKKNGEEILMEITSHKIIYNNRKAILSIASDVTEQVKIQNELKQSEEKYHSLIENAGDGIFLVDKNSRIIEVNTSIGELLGYTREELLRMKAKDLFFPEEINKSSLQINLSTQDEVLTNETRLKRKDGSLVEVEINETLLKDDNCLSIVRNITKRKKIEAELFEKKEQLQLFVEHSPASLAMFDNDMKYMVLSRRWITDYNLQEKNIIGKSHYEIFPEVPQRWKEIHKRCLMGAVESNEEDSFLRADGSIEWLRWEIRPWYKAKGEIGGVIMFTEVITERKRADERFKNQFLNSPDLILYINKRYKIEVINRVFSDGRTIEEITGADCIEILPEESRESTKIALDRCFETRENQEIENSLITGRWVRLRMVPVIVDNEVTHVMVFVTDLSERKHAELKLKRSEEKHRALTENISDAIVLVNEKFEIEYQSPSADAISGYKCDEIKGKPIFSCMHPDEIERGNVFFKKAFLSPDVPMQNQFRIINKFGQVVWIEGTLTNLLNNESVGAFIMNYRDISSRKKYEEQQELMVSIVNSSDDAIISKDINGLITSWNIGAEKILGYTAEETIGRHVSLLLPLELRGEEKNILEEVRNGVSIDHYETQRRKKDGTVIDVSLTISPIKDVLGNVIGASKIMRDITEQKKYENDLIHFNAELKKTNSELDRFVYSTSHDLRAPLKSMLGLIYMIREDVGLDSDELLERLTMLSNSVEKLDDFIEEILHYSRNARVGLEYNEIDFEKMIKEITGSYKFIGDVKDLQLNIEIDSKEKFISDSSRLSMVLNNLFSNALKYKDTSKTKSFVNITVEVNKSNAIIVVEDNGIGIKKEDLEKVFEMFYRATSLSSGSGLGLYIVKEAVEKIKGKIQVESELHQGTKFIIEISNQIGNLN